ncbi:hypothetical protein Glove_225g23 [Diversispora epigaea]|uniref:Uncharacterized protein n=1 Tax=Diversispora epigaea TaxID=1348612 RepID=A0A397IES1_9GLOM|nr:hypothetical protein Glove_225g23 [Diversispora epigaea]
MSKKSIAGDEYNGHVDRKVDNAWNATFSCVGSLPQKRSLQPRNAVQIGQDSKWPAHGVAENIKLKQAIEENAMLKIRFEKLEKKNKTNTAILIAENAELKVHKGQISNEIKERNWKKKLQSQGLIQNTSFSSYIQNEVNPIIDQAQNTEIKIPYNKRVEQDLKHDLSVFIKENNNKINNIFDIQIPEFSLEIIIIESTKVTAQNIANLFVIVIKIKQKEILCWYCYYKVYTCRQN